MEVPINYWAILVCGIASMILGSLWYGPVFGKIWQELSGWDKVDAATKERAMKKVNLSYALAFVGALVMAYVLAHTVVFAQTYTGDSGMSAVLQGAFFTWIGFVAPVTMGSVLWENKSWKFWCLTSTYYLVQLLIFAAILVYWPAK